MYEKWTFVENPEPESQEAGKVRFAQQDIARDRVLRFSDSSLRKTWPPEG
jgi:hypothetical protein